MGLKYITEGACYSLWLDGDVSEIWFLERLRLQPLPFS